MAQPIILTATLAAAVADGISVSQSPGAAGDLTITGSLASGGVATLTTAGIERQVIITSAANDSSKTFTVYGTNASGTAIQEDITGANGGVATSVNYYQTVTRVAISAASAGAVTVGTNGVGASRPLVPNYHTDNFLLSVGAVVTGTVNFTGQYTYDDINKLGGSTGQIPQVPTWWDWGSMTSKTANADAAFVAPITGFRIKMNSGTGTVAATCVQSDMLG